MITEEQYHLMVSAEDGVKSRDYAIGTFDSIREYLCVYEWIDTYTTRGVVKKPYMYGLNDDGLNEKRLYEKKRDNHSKKTAKERSPKLSLNKLSISEQVIATVIGGCIMALLSFFASRFF